MRAPDAAMALSNSKRSWKLCCDFGMLYDGVIDISLVALGYLRLTEDKNGREK